MNENEEVKVYELANRRQPLATIVLNGYNISGSGPLGLNGQMRSFKMVTGNLRQAWAYGQVLSIQDRSGREKTIRIVALPADEHSAGLVEFV